MRNALTIAALLVVQLVHAQSRTTKPPAQLSFSEKMELASWLCTYDSIATYISDVAMTMPYEDRLRVGRQWFVYQHDTAWYSVWGKYNDGKYDMVAHYTIQDSGFVDNVCEYDTALAGSYSRAIDNAYLYAAKVLRNSQVRFNKFIRSEQDSTISIWLLPSVQSANVAMYGGEFYYKFDKTGTEVIDREEYFTGRFRGFKTGNPREIHLDYSQDDAPRLGAVYYAWRNRKVFGDIYIENRSGSMVLSYNKDEGYHWVTTGKKK